MRQMASIQIIKDILPINGADSIELVKIKGWQCVAKKGEFKKGDFCVYFEIDSLLPDNEYFSFLSKGNKLKTMQEGDKIYTGYKLKTVKLKGELSQGLALPTYIFLEFNNLENLYEGLDVSNTLGIIKYEAPIPECLSGLVKGEFPSFIPKTDEERIQNINFDQFKIFDYYVTEKLEGSSITIYNYDGYFGVCSRNLDLLDGNNAYWNTVKKYPLLSNLESGFAIQGELIGPGIQGNIYKLNNVDFRVYNVYSIIDNRYLSLEEMLLFIKKYDLKFVPVLNISVEFNNSSINSNLFLAEGKSELNSLQEREGIVVRSVNSNISKQSFKIISNKYLLNS